LHASTVSRSPEIREGYRRNEVFVEVQGAGAEIRKILLRRDIYYTGDGECGVEEPIVIPRGRSPEEARYFVLGDNSARSYDSRFWGDWYGSTIPRTHVIGTPILIFWPLGRFRIFD
jgi:hypothetical protein